MAAPPRLDDLAPRICILGPSNAGKSTLADAIERGRGWPAVHLDQLHHQPGTDWRPRPAEVFAALHREAVAGECWVIEGNYSALLPERLARATGVIEIDVPLAIGLARYLHRCWFARDRKGGLAGASNGLRWPMLCYLLLDQRRKAPGWIEAAVRSGLPRVTLGTPRAAGACYRAEGLTRR